MRPGAGSLPRDAGRSLLYHAGTVFERDGAQREIALRMATAQLGETYTHAADRAHLASSTGWHSNVRSRKVP